MLEKNSRCHYFSKKIRSAIGELPVCDIHSHLNVEEPDAKNLADILLYHHVWIELISSGMAQDSCSKSGMPQEMGDTGIPPKERVRACVPYLKNINNTTLGYFLKIILTDLFSIEEGRITEKNWESVYEKVGEKLSSAKWKNNFLSHRCNIKKTLTVHSPFKHVPDKQFDLGWEIGGLFLHSGKLSTLEVWEQTKKRWGEIKNASDLQNAITKDANSGITRKIKAFGVWWPSSIRIREISENEVDSAIQKFNEGKFIEEEISVYSSFSLRCLFEAIRKSPVRTIQFLIGAIVKRPHRSMTQWEWDLTGWADVFNEFEDLKFNLSTASDLYTQDIAILAKHFPNVSVAGYWWHTLYPFYIKKSLETRLDMIPSNKIIAYFSDAYHSQWCYPKLKLVKNILAEVLAERVSRGFYSEEEAIEIAKRILFENGMNIYNLTRSEDGKG